MLSIGEHVRALMAQTAAHPTQPPVQHANFAVPHLHMPTAEMAQI